MSIPPALACAVGLGIGLGQAPPGWAERFRDGFDRPRPDLWDRSGHTFPMNAARFRPENAATAGGRLALTLDRRQLPDRRFAGAEQRTRNAPEGFHRFGRFETRMRAARGSGVVSSFFLYRYDPWQEVDVEFLGKDTTRLHLNIFYNPGPEGARNNHGDLDHQTPVILDLGFDAAADFHSYAIEWEPGVVRWSVDGRPVHEERADRRGGRIPDLPMQLMMNIWFSEAADWAGPMDPTALPTRAEYDEVAAFGRPEPGAGR